MDILASYLTSQTFHIIALLSIFIFTWHKSLRGKFLIDDDMGIAPFSDKFRPEQKKLADGKVIQHGSPNYDTTEGEIIPELKVDYYNHDLGKDDKGQQVVHTYKNTDYNRHLGFPGSFMRWHRVNIGKKFQVIGKNKHGHDVFGLVQDPFRHHLWSLFIQSINIILVYAFLTHLFGSTVAFYASLLFAVNPLSCQTVAWISGINYLYSLMFCLINLVITQHIQSYYILIPLTLFLSFASSMTLLPGSLNWVILLLLGRNWEAFTSLIASLLVFARDGLGAISLRKTNFKEQNMEKTTFLSKRKPIVAMKTFWYYVKLMLFPFNLGLYHEYGYHYDETMERIDANFWFGLISFLSLIFMAFVCPLPIKLGIIWMITYWLIFSNLITANQFVVDRYIFIPSLGFCLILAYLLPSSILNLIAGFYIGRTMCHLWTFKDQESFYLSNFLNFQKSEVSLGNLGVVYVNAGKTGKAIETWIDATKINPFYDVPWYNLYSVFRSTGQISEAREFLKNCLKCKTVHFKERWEKELADLEKLIAQSKAIQPPVK